MRKYIMFGACDKNKAQKFVMCMSDMLHVL